MSETYAVKRETEDRWRLEIEGGPAAPNLLWVDVLRMLADRLVPREEDGLPSSLDAAVISVLERAAVIRRARGRIQRRLTGGTS